MIQPAKYFYQANNECPVLLAIDYKWDRADMCN